MIRSAPSASIASQCSCSALSTYMHDGQVAHSVTAVSDLFLSNVNIACSCSNHMNHSKECACKHEDDGRMFWILDSGASTDFTPHHSDFVDYVELKCDDCIPVQTAGGVIHVTGCHISNLGVHLISLGQLLNHGAKVQGDMHLLLT